ncbi:RimK family alpha-L-glutamate ligase [Anaeromyxobacter paludicola]|uniref:Tetrahydromethanopterin:alpha-L-glutamate ligase n=1 Tax=Anaeromyxobacter paludicola TaxID=2918171 RepID=A0ABM7X766_9BACT|nr:RimK family alpha-L-glutamate ligase [Anaeromyxobacter paludicola]BDG07643.1 tetrahydromethanopterin:alpha-L-glutamate ligase [Anaeromyxobacter paludicola]
MVTAWPEEDWHSQRLLEALGRRGAASAVDPASLSAFVEEGVDVRAGGEPAGRFDAFVLVRGLGRAGDPDVQFEIYRALEESGAVVVNAIDALLAAQDKFRTTCLLARAGLPTPRAAVAQRPEEADAALEALGDAVLKPVTGSLGEGLLRVRDDAAGREALRERLARDGAVYLQEFVPTGGTDLRLFVVGGAVVGAMERVAPPGEWRTNVAQGARVRAYEAAGEVRAVAESAAAALGLDYAGVDLADGGEGMTVLEVNGNPSWRGILEATGQDMAERIADHVLARATCRLRRGVKSKLQETGATHG